MRAPPTYHHHLTTSYVNLFLLILLGRTVCVSHSRLNMSERERTVSMSREHHTTIAVWNHTDNHVLVCTIIDILHVTPYPFPKAILLEK